MFSITKTGSLRKRSGKRWPHRWCGRPKRSFSNDPVLSFIYSHSCECRGCLSILLYNYVLSLSTPYWLYKPPESLAGPFISPAWLNSHSFRKATRRNGFVKFSPPTSPSATLANPSPSAYSTPCSKFFTHNLSPARHRVAVTRVRIVYYLRGRVTFSNVSRLMWKVTFLKAIRKIVCTVNILSVFGAKTSFS